MEMITCDPLPVAPPRSQFCQIHDEVILEGPEEHADEALALVIEDMEHPFESSLLVDLNVDGCYAKSWYEAK